MSSIVLIGLRGVGKSTLGLLALAALNYNLVDLNEGVANEKQPKPSKESQFKFVVTSLTSNSEKSIIILPATCVDYKPTVDFLANYGTAHIIIHIECEESRILSYIGYEGSLETGLEFIRNRFKRYRYCSRYDYFNGKSDTDFSLSFPNFTSVVNLLALKNAEDSFIRFLSFVIQTENEPKTPPKLAATINFPDILDYQMFSELMVVGADAVSIIINMDKFISFAFPLKAIAEFISGVRRTTKFKYPIVMSANFNADKTDENKKLYLEILLLAVRLGAEYLMVDMNLVQTPNFLAPDILRLILKGCGRTQPIARYHQEEEKEVDKTENGENGENGKNGKSKEVLSQAESSFWLSNRPYEILVDARAMGFNLVVVTKTAELFQENFDVQLFLRKRGQPAALSAYNTGDLGRFSRICNRFLTPTEPCLSLDDGGTGLKLSAREVNKALYASFIEPQLSFYVVGSHVGHSLSPSMHNAAHRALGLPHTTVIHQCNELAQFAASFLRNPGFGGACMIRPFKIQAMKFADKLLEHAQRIGAANTLCSERSTQDGNLVVSIRAENTDWVGIRDIVLSHLSPINGMGESRSALVVGAGGMGRASLYALISMGIKKIYLYNRTEKLAHELARHFNDQSPLSFSVPFARMVDFNVEVVSDINTAPNMPGFVHPTIIVNCVPATDADTGQLNKLRLHDLWFGSTSGGVFADIGYDPLISPLMLQARRNTIRGWITTNGLDYLHAQALPQYEILTGKIAPSQVMRVELMNRFAASVRGNIV